ncbi:MAG: multicopper oxidase domain-containing protein [Hydrogenophaga sp.]|uniref:multicopper oxidase family protein n=1 Tax=Hydrogenophaga sp. TaxID=1904254 RepID=UPI0026343D39|nr:multicopper oxidase domain-containing protein [Hydrogenophaga sp.]MCV0438880.1 multicopper oxidase domain-containing protein [Hydrogenophaga sp.]
MNSLRRQVLIHSVTAATAAGLGLPAWSAQARDGAGVDIHIELHAVPDHVAIRSGAQTRVWRYRGRLLRGAAGALDTSMLAPVIRVRRGQRMRIDLVNGLPEPTIIHWHGLHVPDDMDGHPRFSIAPGARYHYEFTVVDRAGSYWFHAHPHGRTGKQVYSGLAGLFLVSDEQEAALGLPAGAQDIPLIIQDREFDNDNQFVYLDEAQGAARHGGGTMGGGMMGPGMMGGGMRSMMAGMKGVLGDQILVNNRPNASLDVERRAHRVRLLNASNTRMYKLAWDDGSPLTVIGTDGGLLGAPVQRDYVMLAPAERVDLWVDFGRWPAGTERTLRSLAFEGGMNMGGMLGSGGGLADGAPFVVHRFRIGEGAARIAKLPERLTPIPPPQPHLAVNFDNPKVFELTMGMMIWGINGADFDMLGASEIETVKLGTQEIWEFRNDGRGSMMGMVMAHSMHVHGLQYRVLGRSMSNKFAAAYETVKDGLIDDGWKDTVLVMPGERVRILLRFADYTGLYLYHCHMLEHEDSGLMRNYLVKA